MKKYLFTVFLSVTLLAAFAFSGGGFASASGGVDFSEIFYKKIPYEEVKNYEPGTSSSGVSPEVIFDQEELQGNMVTVDGEKYEDVVVVTLGGKNYILTSLAAEYKAYGKETYKNFANNFDEYIKFRLKAFADVQAERYPYSAIVSINGVPWQETEYKDFIIQKIKENPDNQINNKPELWETLENPKFNGLARYIHSEDMTKEEVLRKAKELGNETVTAKNVKDDDKEEETGEEISVDIEIKNGAVLKIGTPNVLIYKNGIQKNNVIMDVEPKVVGEGHTMIPLRGVFDQMGARLRYDGNTREVTIETEDKTVVLKLNTKEAEINGEQVRMSSEVFTENGRTLLPLRFVGEQLGYKVKWMGEEKKIIVQQ